MADTDRRRSLPPELAAAALVGAAAMPMTRLFEAGPLGNVVLGTMAASLTVCWGSRRLRLPPLLAWSVSILALVWFVSVWFFRETLWGPFPSIESVEAIGQAVRVGARETAEEIAPVVATEPLLMLVCAGVWVTTWLVDAASIWLRNPLLSIASVIPLFVLPGAILESKRPAFEIVLFLATAAWVLFIDQRRTMGRWGPAGAERAPGWRVGPAFRLGATGAVLVAVLAQFVPGYGGEPALRGFGTGSRVYFNPFVAIKPALDSSVEQELFRVNARRATYYRLTALDTFDGRIWKQRDDRPVVPFEDRLPAPAVDSVEVAQTITISALAGPWLPAAYRPVQVEGNAADRETDSDTVLVGGRLEQGLTYDVISYVPRPTGASLDRPITYDTLGSARYLALPRSVPAKVTEIAREVAGDEPTPYRKAIALQTYLRTFRYDEDVAAGHSFDSLVEFLTKVKRGYCEQFAASMAVMARLLGIPSRVAIGFGLGNRVGTDAYQITTRHAHAWVELYFGPDGWLAFEPTPRGGVSSVPRYAIPPGARSGGGRDDPRTNRNDRSNQNGSNRPDIVPSSGPADDDPAEGGAPPWRAILFGLVALVLGAAFLPALPALRRARVMRRPAQTRDVAALRYVDFLDWCAAAGLGKGTGETPFEHGARLAAAAADPAPIGRLGTLVEELLWAPPDGITPAQVAAATAEARAALRPSLTRRKRARTLIRWGPRMPR